MIPSDDIIYKYKSNFSQTTRKEQIMRYTKVAQNAFSQLQVNAGILLKHFDIEAAGNGYAGFVDSDIICATTGGINPVCTPTYSDLAEDVDNAPANLKEYKHLDYWDCSISTTLLGTDASTIKLALGSADISNPFTGAQSGSVIKPRKDINQGDFEDIWWVGDRADGGLVAIRLLNSLSTGGFSLQTSKNGKGNISVTITGHVSLQNQDVVPMEFYTIDPVEGTIEVTGVGLAPSSATLEAGDTLQLEVEIYPSTASDKAVTFASSSTSVATVDARGLVTAKATGSATITVTTHDGNKTDTCAVTVAE
jgi:hypothetical protein